MPGKHHQAAYSQQISNRIVALVNVKPVFRVAKSRAGDDNLRYNLHQNLQNRNRFVFVGNRCNQAAMDSHNASTHFQDWVHTPGSKTNNVEIIQAGYGGKSRLMA